MPVSEANEAPAEERKVRTRTKVLFFGGLLAALVLVVVLVLTIATPASAAANGFLAAMRSGHVDEARAFATPDFAARLGEGLATSADADLMDERRTLERLRSAEPIELGSSQLSAGFTSGCLTTDLKDGRPLRVVVKRQGGKWRVASVRTETTPRDCEFVPN